MSTKLYLIDCGSNRADLSVCLYRIGEGQVHINQIYAAYVDSPEGKILVDTGLDVSDLPERMYKMFAPEQQEAQILPNALKMIGVKPEDIDIVINTHLHVEHCGYNKIFPKATWLIQKKELFEGLNPEKFEPTYIRKNIVAGMAGGLRTEGLDGDYEVVNGVQIVSTPGHTEGHQSVMVETENSGVFALTGDMCMIKENYEGSERTSPEGWPPGAHQSLREDMRSLRKLKKLVGETKAKTMKSCVPLYSHDSEEWAKWKHAPNYYS